MAGHIESDEREKPTMKITQQGSHSESMEKLKPLQTSKSKRIQHHQTSFTTNAKGSSLGRKQEKEKNYNNKPKTVKKMVIGTYISIITLNVNRLNAPTKKHRLAEWIQKQDPYTCCLKRPTTDLGTHID